MKKFFVLVMLLVVGSALVGCQKDDTIGFGVIGPFTGSLSSYGEAVRKGVVLAVEEINRDGGVLGKQVVLYDEDDEGEGAQALAAFGRIANKIDVLIGEVTSGNSKIIAAEAEDNHTPMISPSATDAAVTEDREYIFRACFLDPDQGIAMAKFSAEDLEATKVAVIYDTSDTYSKGVAEAYRGEALRVGLEVVMFDGGFRPADTDYSSLITTLNGLDVDVVFAPVYYEQASVFITQFRNSGNEIPVLGADGFDGIMTVSGVNPAKIDNVYFSNHYLASDLDNTRLQAFITAYQAKYEETPNAFSALGYDATYIAAAAIREAGNLDPIAIKDALTVLTYVGVTGSFQFNETGNPEKGITIVKYVQGVMEKAKVLE
ncbi:MAG: ABC transporter substrate-binding protein [Bacilli bacterium]